MCIFATKKCLESIEKCVCSGKCWGPKSVVFEAHIEVAAWGAVTQERDVLSLAAQTLITLCHTAALLFYTLHQPLLCVQNVLQ